MGQAIGDKAKKLSSFLGTEARNGRKLPLTYNDWRAVPKSFKKDIWYEVKSKFDLEKHMKRWVYKSLGKKWRDWKARLKSAHYTPHETDEERLSDINARVVPEQWPFLKIGHTAGTKSFARVREEERAKRPNGEEPTRLEMFMITHTRKNGQPVDEASSEAMSKLREKETQVAQQPEMSQGNNARDDIFSQVMGEDRHGYVRTYGLGPSPLDVWGSRPNRFESQKKAVEANKAAAEEVRQMEYVKEMTNAFDNMKQSYIQLQAEMVEMRSSMGIRQDPDASITPETPSSQPGLHPSSSSRIPSH